ncbi:MAG: shikimate dehydrogenase [Parachlamydiaceae bacterium]
MICVVIKGPDFEKAAEQIEKALPYADLVELRLDSFTTLNLNKLKNLRSQFSIPMIFTLRSLSQGGDYIGSEENRIADIRRLATLEPEYIDLEHDTSSTFINELSYKFPNIKLILSYHNFKDTPKNLDEIYREMRKTPASFYKIAVYAKHISDALRLLIWAQQFDEQLIPISMGPHGQISRILGKITYASLDDSQMTAPGQLSAQTLIERYHYRSPKKALYGLIGDPIDQSISDVTHNNLIGSCSLNAVYIKMEVKPSELSEFLNMAKELPFRGLSITMPLKELILPFLDNIDPQARNIGAVNTLLIENGKISGWNTDGTGALNAIERQSPVKGKHVVIIGAGGSAKAIAYEAIQRGARVTIVNRDAEKAEAIAKQFGCIGQGLEYIKTCFEIGYDILINSTPVVMPIPSQYILSGCIVMDVKTKPKKTEFLKNSEKKGCRIIYGYEMFIEQAIGQFNLWFDNKIDSEKSREILTLGANQCLSVI